MPSYRILLRTGRDIPDIDEDDESSGQNSSPAAEEEQAIPGGGAEANFEAMLEAAMAIEEARGGPTAR